MKFSDLFKKSAKTTKISNMEALSKEKLGKVTGGGNGDATTPLPVDAARVKSHSNQNNN